LILRRNLLAGASNYKFIVSREEIVAIFHAELSFSGGATLGERLQLGEQETLAKCAAAFYLSTRKVLRRCLIDSVIF